MAVQWVHLGEEVLVASTEQVWLGQPDLGSITYFGPMSDSVPSPVESTRNLVDGAIAAAERKAVATAAQPAMTPLRWAWHLAASWYSAVHSIALMPLAAQRFAADGRDDLARFARQKHDDERGHEQFPLSDLRALGYDAEALVAAIDPDPAVVAGIDYARSTLEGEDPVQFLGYMYALECRMMRIPESWIVELEATLPAGSRATAGLRLHAGELDLEHVEQAIAFFATLGASDRSSIVTGCHRITEIRCAGLLGPQPSETELDEWLSPFALDRPPTIARRPA